jgi:hypothetical protein
VVEEDAPIATTLVEASNDLEALSWEVFQKKENLPPLEMESSLDGNNRGIQVVVVGDRAEDHEEDPYPSLH